MATAYRQRLCNLGKSCPTLEYWPKGQERMADRLATTNSMPEEAEPTPREPRSRAASSVPPMLSGVEQPEDVLVLVENLPSRDS